MRSGGYIGEVVLTDKTVSQMSNDGGNQLNYISNKLQTQTMNSMVF